MDWLHLLALLGEGTGGAFLVRQLFGFTKFVLKRKAVIDVRTMPAATWARCSPWLTPCA
jgi:hypothetical protein